MAAPAASPQQPSRFPAWARNVFVDAWANRDDLISPLRIRLHEAAKISLYPLRLFRHLCVMPRANGRTRLVALAVIVGLLLWSVTIWTPDRLAMSGTPAMQPDGSTDDHVVVPPRLSTMLRNACADCHAATTEWPWYASVPPINVVIASHVRRGRLEFTLPSWAGATSTGRRA